MTTKLVLFSIALLTLNIAFADRGLTPVERETCLSIPKVTPAKLMKKGIHYEERTYCSDEDYQGNCTDWSSYINFKHFYFIKTTTDYYNSAGKLVTTKRESDKQELLTNGNTTEEGEEKLILEAEKLIFNDSKPTCSDSFYK